MDEIDFPPRAFNDGEVSVQKQRGVTQEAIETNYMVTPFLPPMSDGFLRSTRFVVMGSVDPEGRVWAHVAYGEPGFFHALSAERVRIAPHWSPDPLLAAHLTVGAPVATLVVDLETRRRFRVNGRVATSEAGAWTVDVGEAYPNCPKYIQKRARLTLTSAPPASAPADVTVSAALSTEQRAQIAAADTFYIATHHHQSGLDVSHRGGRSGFVRILTDREIVWPDYKGNNLFMSLGNIAVNPHCGVTFVNPETGSALQLTGRAELIWDSNLSLDLAQLSVRFRITSVRSTPHYSPLRYKLVQPSPFNPQLQDRQSPLSLLPSCGVAARCVGVHDVTPSSDVRTFRFRTDSALAPQPVPGQYVTLRFPMNGVLTERTWTITSLSGSLPRNEFEVSVKRKPNGAVSNWIHDHLNGQSEIRFEVCGVSGDFSPFKEGENGALALRHPKHSSLLLLAGGIGVTPFIPVVRHLAAINFPIKTNLILSNKDVANAPFVEELRRVEFAHPERLTLRLCLTQAASAPAPHYAGRLTAQAIRDLCPDLANSGVYVCGPEAYIRHTLSLLAGLGVPADSVALERFDF